MTVVHSFSGNEHISSPFFKTLEDKEFQILANSKYRKMQAALNKFKAPIVTYYL